MEKKPKILIIAKDKSIICVDTDKLEKIIRAVVSFRVAKITRKEAKKKWRKNNKDKTRESNRRYREKNKEKILDKNKKYREKIREQIKDKVIPMDM